MDPIAIDRSLEGLSQVLHRDRGEVPGSVQHLGGDGPVVHLNRGDANLRRLRAWVGRVDGGGDAPAGGGRVAGDLLFEVVQASVDRGGGVLAAGGPVQDQQRDGGAVDVEFLDQAGRVIGIIPKPQNAWLANVGFAGAGLDVLYVTTADKVFKRKTKAKGVLTFLTPVKPPAPRL